ncbi:MAG: dTDP-4-dehydrorhamnose reductase [Chitinophagaceae bacterium]|nr:dTDP-4-dehydrorhamnose reductase [Oligoflexus sp.]
MAKNPSLDNARILITGVQGQVGFELVKSLSTLGAEIILAARKPQALEGLGYTAVALDLTNEQNIRDVLNSVKPNIIINPAAYTAVDKAEDDKANACLVNQKAVEVMASVMNELKGAIVHFSTDYVYNANHDHSNVETDATSPVNVYAASKLAGEEALRVSGVPHIILRTSWVYGINGNNFVKTMLKLGRDRESLRIVDDQVGSPTSATTLALVVSSILQQGFSDPVEYIKSKQGVYNISDRGFTTWFAFAKEIFVQAKRLGIELKIKDVEGIKTADYKTPAARPLNSRLSLEKIHKEFHVVPPTWQQSLGTFLHQSHIKLL